MSDGFGRAAAKLYVDNPTDGTALQGVTKTQILDELQAMGEPFAGSYEEAIGKIIASSFTPVKDPRFATLDGKANEPVGEGAFALKTDPDTPETEQDFLRRELEEEDRPKWWQHVIAGAAAVTHGATPATVGAVAGSPWGPLGMAIGAITMALGEPVTWALEKLTGKDFQSPAEGLSNLLTQIGVPESETKAAQLLETGTRTAFTLAYGLLPAAGAAANAIGAAQASAQSAALTPGGAALVPGAQAPVGTAPGIVQNFLQTMSNASPIPVMAGEIAETFAGEGGRQLARRGTEALGIDKTVGGDTIESLVGMAASMLGGGLVEGGLEFGRRTEDITSNTTLRGRDPETDLGPEPLTRSEINRNDFMSTQRGQNIQAITNNMLGGSGEIPRQRFWQNQQRLKNYFAGYEVEVDDLGAFPDFGPPLLDNFLRERGRQLTENVNLRDYVMSQMPDEVVPTPRAQRYIEDQLAELAELNDPVSVALRDELAIWSDATQDLNFKNLNTTRGRLSDGLSADSKKVIQSDGRQMWNQFYAEMVNDMTDYVRATGGENLAGMWRTSQDNLSKLAGDLNTAALRGIVEQGKLNPDNMTPGVILERLNSSDPAVVEMVYRGMDEEGKLIMRQAVLVNTAESQDFNHLSPNLFSHRVAENSKALGIVLSDDERLLIAGEKAWYDQTFRAEELSTGMSVGPKGLPISAVGGGGTAISAGVRKFGPLALLASIGTAGALGKIARYAEKWPHIQQLFMELVDLSPTSESAVRLSRIIGQALEHALETERMSPRVQELIEPREMYSWPTLSPPPREE